ncbi:MAG: hypothetical protein ACKVZ0_03385 [Gemmatimonadales bacterium]
MRKTLPLPLLAYLIAFLAIASPAIAQRPRVVFTPFVGGYIPFSDLGSIDLNIGGFNVTAAARGTTVATFGARFGYYTRGRVAVEGSFFTAASKTRLTVGGTRLSDVDGDVQGGSVKAAYRVTDRRTDTDFFVSAGLSGTKHSGDVFTSALAEDQFDIGGVVGMGLHVLLSPQVTFRVEGDLNLYKWSLNRLLASRTQTDLLLTAGLGLRLGR